VNAGGEIWELNDWEEVAEAMGGGLTARQVMERWYYYLRPGISREEFTIAERRDSLRASIVEPGNWNNIAAIVGDGQSRSSAQVKSVVNTLQSKLERFHIRLHHPSAVDNLPDRFFERVSDTDEIRRIRNEYYSNRIAALQQQIEMESSEDAAESE
jgi:hypothetical protein